MKPEAVLKIFEEAGALLSGHFILSSGNHSNRYLQCALVTQYPRQAAALADALAEPFAAAVIDVVLGPAVGGIVIAQEAAQALARKGNTKVRAVFCERQDGKMVLRRGFHLEPGERVLAVEDVITTGGSIREAISLARHAGAVIAGAASFVDRSAGTADLGASLTSLLRINTDIYPPDHCPLCQQGQPAVKPGSRGLK